MSNLNHGMKLRSLGWRLSFAAAIVLVVGTSVVSCKTRCFDGRKCSGTTPLARPDANATSLWSPDFSSGRLLDNAAPLYVAFYSRFLEHGDEFPVPEFQGTADAIEKYFQDLVQSVPAGAVRATAPAILQPLNTDRDHLQALMRKLFPGAPETFLDNRLRSLEVEVKAHNDLARRFNESADRACMTRRYSRWRELTYPKRFFGLVPHSFRKDSRVLTYQAFWQGFVQFASALSVPCETEQDPQDTGLVAQFCRFPTFCLPSVFADLPVRSFNALVHVPLYWMGVTKGLSITDGVAMTPEEYLEHDFDHADFVSGSDGPSVLMDAINESVDLNKYHDFSTSSRSTRDLSLTYRTLTFGTGTKELPLFVSPERLGAVLDKRAEINHCIHRKIEDTGPRSAEQLHDILFYLNHELPTRFESFSIQKLSGPRRAGSEAVHLMEITRSCLVP